MAAFEALPRQVPQAVEPIDLVEEAAEVEGVEQVGAASVVIDEAPSPFGRQGVVERLRRVMAFVGEQYDVVGRGKALEPVGEGLQLRLAGWLDEDAGDVAGPCVREQVHWPETSLSEPRS